MTQAVKRLFNRSNKISMKEMVVNSGSKQVKKAYHRASDHAYKEQRQMINKAADLLKK